MAKKGTFGGSRFGGPEYGKTGFKRGFGRAGFGKKREFISTGIEEEMMSFFKNAVGGKFDFSTGEFKFPQSKQQESGIKSPRGSKAPSQGSITVRIPGKEFLTGGGPISMTTGQGISEMPPKPTGTPKTKKVKFRPKLTPGAR